VLLNSHGMRIATIEPFIRIMFRCPLIEFLQYIPWPLHYQAELNEFNVVNQKSLIIILLKNDPLEVRGFYFKYFK